MDISTALAQVSKAIAGALVNAVVALAARFGFNADQATVDAVNVIVTAVVAAAVGFVAVYMSPKNKRRRNSGPLGNGARMSFQTFVLVVGAIIVGFVVAKWPDLL